MKILKRSLMLAIDKYKTRRRALRKFKRETQRWPLSKEQRKVAAKMIGMNPEFFLAGHWERTTTGQSLIFAGS